MAYTATIYSIYMLNIVVCLPSQYTPFFVTELTLVNSFLNCGVNCDSIKAERALCHIIHLLLKRDGLFSSIVYCGVCSGSKQ